MTLLSCCELSFVYPGQSTPALSAIRFSLQAGEFAVLCGPSGCGKSTLLRCLTPSLAPHGSTNGRILFAGAPLDTLSPYDHARRIGFVRQSPDDQIVTDKVWHELASGLESLGVPTPVIRRRVAEMAAFFGIEDWFAHSTAELSGGQKQLLNLAAVMVMQPDLLLLDEPTSQLDPVAAGTFLATLAKLNRELGTTILLSEHRLDEVFPLAHQVLLLDGGQLVFAGSPDALAPALKARAHSFPDCLPTAARVWASVETATSCPLTLTEGRSWLGSYTAVHPPRPLPPVRTCARTQDPVLEVREAWFRYEKEGADIVKGLSLRAYPGQCLALLGGNGAGKTTALQLMAGNCRPYRGSVSRRARAALLPQDPRLLFLHATLREELTACSPAPQALEELIGLCRLSPLLDRHPYDLSGGEQQRAALAKLLLTEPELMLLDEPTKGLDESMKRALGCLLLELLSRGVSVVMVSHDMDFCARFADRCVLFFGGTAVSEDTPRAFFSDNRFYTTFAARMAREIVPDAVTAEDLICACGGQLPPSPPPADPPPPPSGAAPPVSREARRRPLLPLLLFLLIPLTVWVSSTLPGHGAYRITSWLILLEAMAPFFLRFEGRKPSARELALLASLCALGVAGRAALFMLPECKPVLALTVLSGVAFGSESGFLVGSVVMLLSNMMFGQGPWMPWQMFAMGLIGALAGLPVLRRVLDRSRIVLCVFGALSALVIYGGILNPASALLAGLELTPATLAAYYLSGLPMDALHAAATWAFLWFGGMPMLRKLERIKTKYGLLDL